jgi:NADPH-dependent 2,4-dienoyl-CoA reductase/sulfur reductase-like enzyme
VVIHTKTQVQQALGAAGRLTGVVTQAGEQLACQILAVAIGVRPRVELARQAGLKIGKGVLVNQFLQTSAPDVFAAGDVAEVASADGGPTTLDVLWPTALAQGKVAGANLAGDRQRYVKSVAFNVTMLTGLKVTIIGAVGGGRNDDLVAIMRGESESWRLLPRAWTIGEHDEANRVRLLVGERQLVGALVMGDQSWSRPLQRLIVGQVDVTPIRARLNEGGLAALRHLGAFYEQWEQAQSRG